MNSKRGPARTSPRSSHSGLPCRPGPVAADRADEDPVQALRRLVREHRPALGASCASSRNCSGTSPPTNLGARHEVATDKAAQQVSDGTPKPASTRPNRSLKRKPTQKSAGGFRLRRRTVRTVRASRHHPATHSLKIPSAAKASGVPPPRRPPTPAAATAPPFEDQAHPADCSPRPDHPADVRRCRAVRSPGNTHRPPQLPVLPHHHSNGHASRWAKLPPKLPLR